MYEKTNVKHNINEIMVLKTDFDFINKIASLSLTLMKQMFGNCYTEE